MTVDDALRRLTAGLTEDQRIARAAAERAAEWKEMDAAVIGGPFTPAEPEYLIEESGEHTIVYPEGYPLKPEAQHIGRHDPASTLRRVEAIRKVIAEHGRNSYGQCETCRDYDFRYDYNPMPWPCPTVRALADIYPEGTDESGESTT